MWRWFHKPWKFGPPFRHGGSPKPLITLVDQPPTARPGTLQNYHRARYRKRMLGELAGGSKNNKNHLGLLIKLCPSRCRVCQILQLSQVWRSDQRKIPFFWGALDWDKQQWQEFESWSTQGFWRVEVMVSRSCYSPKPGLWINSCHHCGWNSCHRVTRFSFCALVAKNRANTPGR